MGDPLPLGFFSVCLQANDLQQTVEFYRAQGFLPVGEDAPGLRVSLAAGDVALTFMSFLDCDLINFRGGHIHQLMSHFQTAGIEVEEYNTSPETQLVCDAEGNPLPDNECGHFTVFDPDRHMLFFNTHPPEREPFEAALRGTSPAKLEGAGESLGKLVYQLGVTNLDASLSFYEQLGLSVTEATSATIDISPTLRTGANPALNFQLRLHQAATPAVSLLFVSSDSPSRQMVDPDGRQLVFCTESEVV